MNELTNKPISAKSVFYDLQMIRNVNPLIHNITNYVVMQTSANMLLAIGASPIMAHAQEELQEIVQFSQALVLNIGTLDQSWIDNMLYAQQIALKNRVPIILDPVGAGATKLRTKKARELLRAGVTVVRGNASEIMALVDDSIKAKGVDAQHAVDDALQAAILLAQTYNCVVVISGQTDLIVTQNYQTQLSYGTPMLTKVTGMGCSATALIAAFCAVNQDYHLAAAHAMALLTLAAQKAVKQAKGPASFYNELIDTLYSLDLTTLSKEWQE